MHSPVYVTHKQVRMYYGSGTVDRIDSGQPADAAASAIAGACSERRTDAAYALTTWQYFYA